MKKNLKVCWRRGAINKMPCKALNLTCTAFWHDRQYNDTMKNKAAKNTLVIDEAKEGDNEWTLNSVSSAAEMAEVTGLNVIISTSSEGLTGSCQRSTGLLYGCVVNVATGVENTAHIKTLI